MEHYINGNMYRISKVKRNIEYLISLTKTIQEDKDKLSNNYVLDCYKNKLEEMKKDIEELEKFVTFIKTTKKKQQL